jgi:2',3'-cyclic-nucleotide 2'-phosphodiesterase (5'-nucleotidase family)
MEFPVIRIVHKAKVEIRPMAQGRASSMLPAGNKSIDFTVLPAGSKSIVFALLLTFLAGACTTTRYAYEPLPFAENYYQVDSTLVADAAMMALIRPFVADMNSRMNRVIAWSDTEITRGRPEGTLNNLSADILRFRAVRELGHPVDIGVANFGGLRAPLPQGNITVGNVYELMPFENTITVLKLTGAQVRIMADQIARRRGEPVSGIRFRIEDDRAVDILVGAEPIRDDRYYWVATNSYVADGGDGIGVFREAVERIDLPVLIRQAMIEYIRARRQLNYELEGRIRNTD